MSNLPAGIVDSIAAITGPGGLLTDPAEMDAYLSREGDKARFSLEDVMSAELQKRVGGGGDSETES